MKTSCAVHLLVFYPGYRQTGTYREIQVKYLFIYIYIYIDIYVVFIKNSLVF